MIKEQIFQRKTYGQQYRIKRENVAKLFLGTLRLRNNHMEGEGQWGEEGGDKGGER